MGPSMSLPVFERAEIGSGPLVNSGSVPIFGIAFGTLEDTDSVVWLPD